MAYIPCNTTLCYLEKDGAWLMLHRTKKKNDYNQDKWIGVGGKFEKGESPDDCLLREVREETGVTLTRWNYRGIVTFVMDDYTELMHLFTADAWTGTLLSGNACDEGVLEWVNKEDVLRLPLWEGDKVFFHLLRTEQPFFSLKLCYHNDLLTSAVLDGKPYPLPVT